MSRLITHPMLAAKVKPEDADRALAAVAYPVIATPKLDGIRCIAQGGEALTRKLLDVPNQFTRAWVSALSARFPHVAFDGELRLRDPAATFQAVSSAVMSRDGEPDLVYHVFDLVQRGEGLAQPYAERLDVLDTWPARTFPPDRVELVHHELIGDVAELLAFEAETLERGYEGVCFRSPDSPYKLGRATLGQGWLTALKRFVDAEAVVVGFEEAEANTNAATTDETGHTKRSHAKAGKVRKGTLGALIVERWPLVAGEDPVRFRIGTGVGLDAGLRQAIWDHQDRYLGRFIKFRYQACGTKDKPRIPSFLGFRDRRDL